MRNAIIWHWLGAGRGSDSSQPVKSSSPPWSPPIFWTLPPSPLILPLPPPPPPPPPPNIQNLPTPMRHTHPQKNYNTFLHKHQQETMAKSLKNSIHQTSFWIKVEDFQVNSKAQIKEVTNNIWSRVRQATIIESIVAAKKSCDHSCWQNGGGLFSCYIFGILQILSFSHRNNSFNLYSPIFKWFIMTSVKVAVRVRPLNQRLIS